MADDHFTFTVDGVEVAAKVGQTVMEACDEAGIYVARLCHHPDLKPEGHCRVCTCIVNGRPAPACALAAVPGMVVENETPQLNADRKAIIEMHFVEGNHFCPACEKSGACELQALAYRLGIVTPTLPYLWPHREVIATHPDIFIDRNRCILCSRCVRASAMVDGKTVFAHDGRGIHLRLTADGKARLDETTLASADKAAHVCPVGAIVIKRTAFMQPQGTRLYDHKPIGSDIEARRKVKETA
jgi:[NiFe] hydrogenase diaphorase moiety small subunit